MRVDTTCVFPPSLRTFSRATWPILRSNRPSRRLRRWINSEYGLRSPAPGYQAIVASTFFTWLFNLFEHFDDSLVALDNDVAEGAGAR